MHIWEEYRMFVVQSQPIQNIGHLFNLYWYTEYTLKYRTKRICNNLKYRAGLRSKSSKLLFFFLQKLFQTWKFWDFCFKSPLKIQSQLSPLLWHSGTSCSHPASPAVPPGSPLMPALWCSLENPTGTSQTRANGWALPQAAMPWAPL